MINANSIKVGNIINKEGRLCAVLKTSHTQPGKGGAFVQMELKDIKDGTKYNERYRSEDKIEKVFLEEQKLQFLYQDNNSLHLMDNNSYEQYEIDKEIISSQMQPFLEENMTLTGLNYNNQIISIDFPNNIEVTIKSTEASVKGQTAASSYKPAILSNGTKIMVPPFINDDDKVIIRSSDLEYIERVKK